MVSWESSDYSPMSSFWIWGQIVSEFLIGLVQLLHLWLLPGPISFSHLPFLWMQFWNRSFTFWVVWTLKLGELCLSTSGAFLWFSQQGQLTKLSLVKMPHVFWQKIYLIGYWGKFFFSMCNRRNYFKLCVCRAVFQRKHYSSFSCALLFFHFAGFLVGTKLEAAQTNLNFPRIPEVVSFTTDYISVQF